MIDGPLGDGDQRALRADARRNRERILDAAWRLLTASGAQRLEMDDVAREAEIAKGTLYRHFASREALFGALVEQGAEWITTALRERIAPEADAPSKLRTLIAVLYDSFEEHHINLDVMLHIRSLRDTPRPSPEGAFAEVPKRIRAILQQGVREGSFRDIDLDYATFVVMTTVHPLTFGKLQKRLGYSRRRAEELAVDMLLHAFGREL